MQCHDCGKSGVKLFEFVDGRRVIHLCKLCKAEREWKLSPDNMPLPKPKPRTFWEKLKRLLGFND